MALAPFIRHLHAIRTYERPNWDKRKSHLLWTEITGGCLWKSTWKKIL